MNEKIIGGMIAEKDSERRRVFVSAGNKYHEIKQQLSAARAQVDALTRATNKAQEEYESALRDYATVTCGIPEQYLFLVMPKT